MGGAIYNSYFGFREIPFSVTPDPRFFYANSLYQEALATLQYGIKNKKGFIVITGEVGTGKTTLLRKLMRQLEASIDSVFIFNTYLSFSELLQLILQDLGLPLKEKTRLVMIQELNEYLMQQLQKGRTVSLLIDEAQNLSDESLEGLRLLSNLETDKEKLLQIVLMGQPELEAKLNKPSLRQLNQRVALRCRLDPLSQVDVGSYIRHRPQVAGYKGSEIFSMSAVKAIWLYSRGTPRLINLICDNALLIAYATNKRFVSEAMVDEASRDLGLKRAVIDLREEVQTANIKTQNRKGQSVQPLGNKPLQRKPQRLAWVALGAFSGAFIAILFAGGAALVIDPIQAKDHLSSLSLKIENLRRITGQTLKFFEGRLFPKEAEREEAQLSVDSQPGLDPQGPVSSKPNAEPLKLAEQIQVSPSQDTGDSPGGEGGSTTVPSRLLPLQWRMADNWKEQPVVIEYGSTISEVANDAYGANRILAMDLLKEFNSHIENLNWVLAGQTLWLPPLSRETLLRKQPDGSYRLILASFPSSMGADGLSQAVRSKGYQVMVTPRRVSDNILLHRVEIEGLKNLEAVNQAWNTALANTWFSFSDSFSAGESSENLSSIQNR
jgi:type II secretory pathway predicted ATPase ExeA